MSEYLTAITELLGKIEACEGESIDRAAELVAETIHLDGIVRIFGCGHSHLAALDSFYRAGGLANVSPMLDTDLMLHAGAAKSSRLEKKTGLGAEILRSYRVEKRDMLFVVSASGKNAVPLELAAAAMSAGIKTVTVSSSEYYSHGGRLQGNCTVHIDSHVPYGDAAVSVDGEMMGGVSTYAACFVLGSAILRGAEIAAARGYKPAVYASGNVDGGAERNAELIERYKGRIIHL